MSVKRSSNSGCFLIVLVVDLPSSCSVPVSHRLGSGLIPAEAPELSSPELVGFLPGVVWSDRIQPVYPSTINGCGR